MTFVRLEDMVGQTLMIGVPGTRATPEVVRHFQELHAGGLILYRINFESPGQLKKLVSDLEAALGRRLLLSADHEGGRVIMFRDGVTVFPDNLAFGRTGSAAHAKKQGGIEARELRRLGIDVNLGPVLDVLTDAYSPNIGIRSYGKDWKLVAELGAARIRAMQEGGVSACAKHFPGKGHAPLDAHLGLPVIRSTWKEMEAVHLRPFRAAIEAGVDCVMTSHPYYPNLDPEPNRIATFSRKIVHDRLRLRFGFEGAILSDDLEMGAIRALCPIAEAGVRAAAAGHDMLLVCHDLAQQREVYRALLQAYRSKQLSTRALESSVERIERLKAKRARRFEGGAPRAEKSGPPLAKKVCLESAAVLRQGSLPLDRKRSPGRKVTVIFPRFSELAGKIMIEESVCKEEDFLKKAFARYGVRPRIEVVPIEPGEREIGSAVEAAKASDWTILFLFDARLYASNKKLLDSLQALPNRLAAVLLRDPYDLDLLQGRTACVTDFGWRSPQILACIDKLFSRE